MLRFLALGFIISWPYLLRAQTDKLAMPPVFSPIINTIVYKLGDENISLKTFQYGDKTDIVFINLHDNETTSINGTKMLLETHRGLLIKIDNHGKRNISFRLDGHLYTFDPNRIFSKTGLKETLVRFGRISNKAVEVVEGFANQVLQLLPKYPTCIIAIHNNSNGEFSVNDYMTGHEKATDAKKVNLVDGQDPDNFFLTTDSLLFENLSAKNYNMVWQDNLQVTQDGSLSVYFGEKNIRYLNCEAEHGKIKQQQAMILAALEVIKK